MILKVLIQHLECFQSQKCFSLGYQHQQKYHSCYCEILEKLMAPVLVSSTTKLSQFYLAYLQL